uniref:G_PROTEIN_RECEP_F1_2 domain-containing protein n=1 Tax=Heterorhabditis bacteriophora TaxID=37862 RepID=A0A1I7WSH3_HETBA
MFHSSDSILFFLLGSAASLFSIFTIFSNLFTIFLLVRYRPMQKSISNLYILSLSIADVLIGLTVFVFFAVHLTSTSTFWFPERSWLCDAWQVADFVLSTVSLYSICAIALDRVWNLEKPLRVFKRSRRLAIKLILCIWISPFVIWIPYYYFVTESRMLGSESMNHTCTSEYRLPFAVPFIAAPILYIPAIALVAMFVRISVVVHGHLSFLKEHSNHPGTSLVNTNSFRGSKESTPFTRTPEQTKKFSEGSQTSGDHGYGTIRTPRSQSPRYLRVELTPLSEEKSSGRERSLSEQLTGRIEQFDVVRAAKAVALILICFLVCWLPFLVIWPIKLYCRSCIPNWLYIVSIFLNYLCSALNPLLYTLSSPRIRIVMQSYCSFFCATTKRRMKHSYIVRSGTMYYALWRVFV